MDLCTGSICNDDVYRPRIQRWYAFIVQHIPRSLTDDTIVANAVGPWVASYNTYTSGEVTKEADTPIWILIIAGLLLGVGFWST
jgi:hypothetical protein